jgi:hypothetical protein
MNTEIEAKFIGDKYVLTKDLTVYTDYFGVRQVFTIPCGFDTDFASVPRIFWAFISPTDEFIRIPALIHDYLYRNKIYTREEDDAIFLEKMLSFDKNVVIKAYLAYLAVRLFGWVNYKK